MHGKTYLSVKTFGPKPFKQKKLDTGKNITHEKNKLVMVPTKKERNKSSKVSLIETYCSGPDRILGISYKTLKNLH
jgi:hypothetical protein